jgi:hypothetical protein
MRIYSMLFLCLIVFNFLQGQDFKEFDFNKENYNINHIIEKPNSDLIIVKNRSDDPRYLNPSPTSTGLIHLVDKEFKLKKEIVIKDSLLSYTEVHAIRKLGKKDSFLIYGFATDSFYSINPTKLFFYFLDGQLNIIKKHVFLFERNAWFNAPAINDDLSSESIMTFTHIGSQFTEGTLSGGVDDIRVKIDPYNLQVIILSSKKGLSINNFRSPYDNKNYFLGPLINDVNDNIIDKYFNRKIFHHPRDRVKIVNGKIYVGGPLNSNLNKSNSGGIALYGADFYIQDTVLTSAPWISMVRGTNYFETDGNQYLYISDLDIRPNPQVPGVFYMKKSHILKVDTSLKKIYEFILGGNNEGYYKVEGITPLINGDLLVYGSGNSRFYEIRQYPFILRLGPDGKIKQLVGNRDIDIRSDLIVYPNPTTDVLKFESEEIRDSKINIYDGHGRLVFRSDITESSIQINTSNIIKGMYFFKITNNDSKEIHSGQFIKY